MGITLIRGAEISLPDVPIDLQDTNLELYSFLTSLRRQMDQLSRGSYANDNLLASLTGYTLSFVSGGSFNPADASTYYVGLLSLAPSATGSTRKIYIPRSGKLVRVDVVFTNGVAGSAETSSVYFRLNDTTDTLISSSVVNNAALTNFSGTNLGVSVTAGDFFEIKWTTPSPGWATNPTTVFLHGNVYIE